MPINTVYVNADILQPAVPVPVQTIVGTDVSLRVNVTVTTTNTYLRELNWYHNGQRINPGRFNFSSDNTSMTITSVTDEDSGEYLVQFDGLRLYPYDKVCEKQTLSMLRQHPLLAPAALFISTDGEINY